MSSRLPAVRAREVVPVATKFIFDHQRGSHAVYYRVEDRARIVIPMHAGRDISPKTLEGIIEDMGITAERFRQLLRE